MRPCPTAGATSVRRHTHSPRTGVFFALPFDPDAEQDPGGGDEDEDEDEDWDEDEDGEDEDEPEDEEPGWLVLPTGRPTTDSAAP